MFSLIKDDGTESKDLTLNFAWNDSVHSVPYFVLAFQKTSCVNSG